MNKKLIFFSLIILISMSFAYAYNLNDVLSGRVSLIDILTGKAVSEAKGFTSQGTWLKSWLPKVDYGEGDIFTGDFNGDGKTDIGVYDAVNGNWLVALSTGTGFSTKTQGWLSGWLPYGYGYIWDVFTGDFNGDGKTDIGVYDTPTGNWSVALSNGNGFDAKGTWLKSWLPKSSYGEGNTFTGDFNGDGKTDIGVYDAIHGNWLVALSTGTGFIAKYTWLKSWLPKRDYGEGNTFTGDFNGDGKTDIGVYDAMNGNWLVALASEPVILTDTGGVYSSGGGFSTKTQGWLSGWLPKRDYGEGNTFTGDFNGDGKTDIGVYDAVNGNWLVALSTGTGFSTKTQGWLSGWLPKRDYGEGNTFTGDFNGDGKTDIGVYDAVNGNWLVALATSTPSYCVDTDNGAVYTKKGNVYGVELGNAFDKADYCLNNTLIREYYCHGANAVINDYPCRDGGICQDGACVMPTLAQSTCTDSDNGQSFYTPGTARFTNSSGGGLDQSDYCLNSTILREFFCTSTNNIDAVNYDCSNGCSNGFCIKNITTPINATCIDSDGEDYYVGGMITMPDGGILYDSCDGEHDLFLQERVCISDTNLSLNTVSFECPYECNFSARACIPSSQALQLVDLEPRNIYPGDSVTLTLSRKPNGGNIGDFYKNDKLLLQVGCSVAETKVICKPTFIINKSGFVETGEYEVAFQDYSGYITNRLPLTVIEKTNFIGTIIDWFQGLLS